MKKFLLLLTLAGGATALLSMQTVGQSYHAASTSASDVRKTRECALLLKRMSRSAEADNWRNRLRAWPCMQRADSAVVASTESGR